MTKLREEFELLATGECDILLLELFLFFKIHTSDWIAELQSKHDMKMAALRDELELRRKMEIHEIEEVLI